MTIKIKKNFSYKQNIDIKQGQIGSTLLAEQGNVFIDIFFHIQ